MPRACCLLFIVLFASSCQTGRSLKPIAVSTFRIDIPYIRREKLANGLQFFSHHDGYLPIVKIRVAFHGGRVALPSEKAGAMELLYDYLLNSRQDLRDELDAIGTSAVYSVDAKGSSIDVTVGIENTMKAVEVLSRMLQEPLFEYKAFEKIKSKHLAAVSDMQRNPQNIADTLLLRSIYGPNHPLGILNADIQNSLREVKLEDLYHAYREFIGPQNIAVITAGRLDRVETLALCNKYFGNWRSGADGAPPVPQPYLAEKSNTWFVARAQSPRTYVVIGGQGVAADANDEYALKLASIAIVHSLAEQFRPNGPTFMGFLSLRSFQRTGYYSLSFSINRQQTPKIAESVSSSAFQLLMNDLDGTSMSSLRSQESLSLVHSFRSLSGIIEKTSEIYWDDLDDDYYIRSLERIQHITRKDVENALHKYYKKEKIHIVVIGDPTAIQRN